MIPTYVIYIMINNQWTIVIIYQTVFDIALKLMAII